MAERIRAINPDCRVTAEQKFFNEKPPPIARAQI
jgi:tRNA A37 threonylcarbamoyladenosine dehydratase